MFKLKKGNVFQKLNNMDRKKAYTLGAVIVVCFFALIILASFMGSAEDESFDGFNSRGYDLAQMPFVNDEAEQFLLASKYPDMQDNGSTLLYSAEEKEERQEADAEEEEEEGEEEEEETSSDEGTNDSSYSGGSYSGGSSGYRGRGGSSGPTQVNRLGNASTAHASGGGITGTWGAPRGDFSPYKSQDKGREIAPQTLQNQNARKALTQFARGSQAAAGLRDGKGGNAKKALMGGTIQGSEAFTDKGIDLSKAGGLALDTNAPTSSADLSNLDKKVDDTARKAKEEKEKEDRKERIIQALIDASVEIAKSGISALADWGMQAGQTSAGAFSDLKRDGKDAYANAFTCKGAECSEKNLLVLSGASAQEYKDWVKANPEASGSQFLAKYSKDGSFIDTHMKKVAGGSSTDDGPVYEIQTGPRITRQGGKALRKDGEYEPGYSWDQRYSDNLDQRKGHYAETHHSNTHNTNGSRNLEDYKKFATKRGWRPGTEAYENGKAAFFAE